MIKYNLDYKTFEEAIRKVEEIGKTLDYINVDLPKALHADIEYYPKRSSEDVILELLANFSYDYKEANDILGYFCFELDFGRDWKIDSIVEKDGRPIKLSTIEDLYKYLCGDIVYLERPVGGVKGSTDKKADKETNPYGNRFHFDNV